MCSHCDRKSFTSHDFRARIHIFAPVLDILRKATHVNRLLKITHQWAAADWGGAESDVYDCLVYM